MNWQKLCSKPFTNPPPPPSHQRRKIEFGSFYQFIRVGCEWYLFINLSTWHSRDECLNSIARITTCLRLPYFLLYTNRSIMRYCCLHIQRLEWIHVLCHGICHDRPVVNPRTYYFRYKALLATIVLRAYNNLIWNRSWIHFPSRHQNDIKMWCSHSQTLHQNMICLAGALRRKGFSLSWNYLIWEAKP